MRYALLIYADPATEVEPGTEAMDEVMAGHEAFSEEAGAAGALLGGEALLPGTTATSVRVASGEVVTSDGPYAETKEVLGGFYLVEAEDLDAAVGWAAKIPEAQHGTIEVRPLMEFD